MELKNVQLIKKSWYRRWWGIVVLVVLALFIALIFAMAIKTASYVWQVKQGKITLSELAGKPNTDALALLRKKVESLDDPYLGPTNAPIVIVEFGDFACPVTKQASPIMKQLLTLYPQKIKFVYRDYPIVTEDSLKAANAAGCAFAQGSPAFWSYHDQLFFNQDDLSDENLLKIAQNLGLDLTKFQNCFSTTAAQAEVKEDYSTALSLELKGTPVFFVNGNRVDGLQTLESWKKAIDYLLSNTK